MLELGKDSAEEHRQVGKLVAEKGFNYSLTFGPEAKNIADGAEKAGMRGEQVKKFEDQKELCQFIKSEMNDSDVILVKGSQGMRMENIVKELMAEPQKAKKLLVRQGEEWL